MTRKKALIRNFILSGNGVLGKQTILGKSTATVSVDMPVVVMFCDTTQWSWFRFKNYSQVCHIISSTPGARPDFQPRPSRLYVDSLHVVHVSVGLLNLTFASNGATVFMHLGSIGTIHATGTAEHVLKWKCLTLSLPRLIDFKFPL